MRVVSIFITENSTRLKLFFFALYSEGLIKVKVLKM